MTIKLPKVSLKDQLETLTEDLADTQMTLDNDQFDFDRIVKDLKRSKDNYEFAKYRLAQFKKLHNLK